MAQFKYPSPYAVRCSGDTLEGVLPSVKWAPCGIVYLSVDGQHGYLYQMNQPHKKWYCPNCGSNAVFQDDIYQEWLDYQELSREEKLTNEN